MEVNILVENLHDIVCWRIFEIIDWLIIYVYFANRSSSMHWYTIHDHLFNACGIVTSISTMSITSLHFTLFQLFPKLIRSQNFLVLYGILRMCISCLRLNSMIFHHQCINLPLLRSTEKLDLTFKHCIPEDQVRQVMYMVFFLTPQ